jgi:hypothetical protein
MNYLSPHTLFSAGSAVTFLSLQFWSLGLFLWPSHLLLIVCLVLFTYTCKIMLFDYKHTNTGIEIGINLIITWSFSWPQICKWIDRQKHLREM